MKYVALEGNIGSGKTTISKMLAKSLNAKLILEEFANNPFLAQFYQNPERYGFSLEMSFLADRFHQLQSVVSDDLFYPITIADYSIHKSLIFAQNSLQGNEFDLYNNLFQIIARNLRQPDLIIYLNRPLPTLLQHIKKRNRPYELGITDTYLSQIYKGYINYFKQNKQLTVAIIDADKYNFINNLSDLKQLEKLIYQPLKPGIHLIN